MRVKEHAQALQIPHHCTTSAEEFHGLQMGLLFNIFCTFLSVYILYRLGLIRVVPTTFTTEDNGRPVRITRRNIRFRIGYIDFSTGATFVQRQFMDELPATSQGPHEASQS